jgi:hypothetical protein
MLLLIVGRIGCAVDAVRTTVLSRRWRGIFALHWAIVSEIVFRDVAFSSLEAALGRVCLCHPSTVVYCLRTRVHGTCIPDERTHNSLLRAASRLQAREFSVSLSSHAGTGLCEGSTFVGGCFHNQLPSSVRATCHVYLRPGEYVFGMHDYDIYAPR